MLNPRYTFNSSAFISHDRTGLPGAIAWPLTTNTVLCSVCLLHYQIDQLRGEEFGKHLPRARTHLKSWPNCHRKGLHDYFRGFTRSPIRFTALSPCSWALSLLDCRSAWSSSSSTLSSSPKRLCPRQWWRWWR